MSKISNIKLGSTSYDVNDKQALHVHMLTSELNTISANLGDKIKTLGYYNVGDGGSSIFYVDSVATAETFSIELANGLYANLLQGNSYNVVQFGAKHDGTTDDANAIQKAIDSLPSGGGCIYFPNGSYALSKGINVGDGKANTVNNGSVSTKNAIKLIGCASNRTGNNPGSEFKLLNNVDTIISVNGRISDVEISNFTIYADGNSNNGIKITACSHSVFKHLYIYGCVNVGLGVYGGKLPTGNYNTFNEFKDVMVVINNQNAIGLEMDGIYSASNDTWISKFDICRFEATANALNCKCAVLKFVDSITFTRCHFIGYANAFTGLTLDASNNADYPAGVEFHSCSISSINVIETATAKIRKNYFIGNGTYDLEKTVNNVNLVGISDTGIPFGGWGVVCQPSDLGLSNIWSLEVLINKLDTMCYRGTKVMIAMWKPSNTDFSFPSAMTGNYALLTIDYCAPTHILIQLVDCDNNQVYRRTKYGGVLTAWVSA